MELLPVFLGSRTSELKSGKSESQSDCNGLAFNERHYLLIAIYITKPAASSTAAAIAAVVQTWRAPVPKLSASGRRAGL